MLIEAASRLACAFIEAHHRELLDCHGRLL